MVQFPGLAPDRIPLLNAPGQWRLSLTRYSKGVVSQAVQGQNQRLCDQRMIQKPVGDVLLLIACRLVHVDYAHSILPF